MWKYVSRRVKDTLDRTYNNVLDVRKTWTNCGQQAVAHCNVDQNVDGCSRNGAAEFKFGDILVFRCTKSNGSNQHQQEKYQKKYTDDGQTRLHNTLLGAITWSGAIICGWYASQTLCLHRRHYGWNNYCQFARIINVPSRALHTNIRSHLAVNSPIPPTILAGKTLLENYSDETIHVDEAKSFKVNNEHNGPAENDQSKKQSVGSAVAELVEFLGETEFKMGVQNIAAGRFRSAVAHLKLATGHHHAGATFNLGLCYEKGLGVHKNLKRAMECYQQASSMGHSKAMFNLGVFYAHGLGGLQKDRTAAEQCFIAAAKLGQNEAKAALNLRNKKDHIDSTDFMMGKEKSSFFFSSTSKLRVI